MIFKTVDFFFFWKGLQEWCETDDEINTLKSSG